MRGNVFYLSVCASAVRPRNCFGKGKNYFGAVFYPNSWYCAKNFNSTSSGILVGGVMEIKPLTLGAEVTGVSLKDPVPEKIIKRIKEEVHKHRLLIFKNQGEITGDRHVEISKWFGELESTFYKHPKSPHPDVFRVSNVEEEGCRNVGRTGWHIDGSFMKKPFCFSLYYMHSVPETGDTGNLKVFIYGE